MGEDLAILFQQGQDVEQQIPEVAGIEGEQACLIGGVELLSLAIGIAFALAGIDVLGSQSLVLPAVDKAAELPCRPALVVDPFSLDQLLHQA